MAPRRSRPDDEDDKELSSAEKLRKYRSALAITRVDLDDCVAQQPELFDHVGEAHAMAVAERDALKLEIKEAEAEADKTIRDEIYEEEEAAQKREEKYKKPTEPDIKRQIILDPKIKKLQRELLEADSEVDQWAALKESFKDRSRMLQETVSLHLARMFQRSSVTAAKGGLAEMNRTRTGALRTARRFGVDDE